MREQGYLGAALIELLVILTYLLYLRGGGAPMGGGAKEYKLIYNLEKNIRGGTGGNIGGGGAIKLDTPEI